eukprot:TRINITY_DN3244_c3_g1_i2.p1 TRINITY_DN3244_c3_g1~~TRINITY_DN3244_c3_g1_i2.p1  ORF type:complete len:289 (+),score=61.20 TRINITY_DN3244_c3_g1_i2:232-1098(+)
MALDLERIKRILSSQSMEKGIVLNLIVTASGLTSQKELHKNQLNEPVGLRNLGQIFIILQIGSIVIEWDSFGLVDLGSSDDYSQFRTLYVTEVDRIETHTFNTFLDPLASRISSWNLKIPSDSNTDRAFVGDLLDAMQIETPLMETTIGDFIQSIRDIEAGNFVTFILKSQVFQLENHSALDQFCWRFENELGDRERMLLMALDRVHWLLLYGHLSSGVDEQERQNIQKRWGSFEGKERRCYFHRHVQPLIQTSSDLSSTMATIEMEAVKKRSKQHNDGDPYQVFHPT